MQRIAPRSQMGPLAALLLLLLLSLLADAAGAFVFHHQQLRLPTSRGRVLRRGRGVLHAGLMDGLLGGAASAASRPGTSASSKQRVQLGDLRVSPMGVGTWSWGNQFLWGYSEDSDAELQRVFDYVLSKGVNWFDSADSYGTGRLEGQSEKLLGQFIREHDYGKGVIRSADDVFVATKIAPYPFRIGKGSIQSAMRSSAKRLGRDVDVGQLHWAPPLGWQEAAYWAGLAELYHRGEIKAIGLSNYGPRQLRRAHRAFTETHGVPLASNQVQFSLVSPLPVTSGLVDVASELGVRVVAYSPLGLGLLTGRYSEARLPEGPRRLLFKELLPASRPVLEAMGEIQAARNKGKKPAGTGAGGDVTFSQIAINWTRAKGAVPIVGLKTVAQAEDNLGALSWALTKAEEDLLDSAVAKLKKTTVQNIFQTP